MKMALSKIFYAVASKALSGAQDRFFDAVQDGDAQTVAAILKKHPDAVSWKKQKSTKADPYRRRFRDRIADISGVGPTHFIGHTALGIAAAHGRKDVVNVLLDGGADIEQRSLEGHITPLGLADFYFDQNAPADRQTEQTETIRTLLNRGANPDAVVTSIFGRPKPSLTRNRHLLANPTRHNVVKLFP